MADQARPWDQDQSMLARADGFFAGREPATTAQRIVADYIRAAGLGAEFAAYCAEKAREEKEFLDSLPGDDDR
jgi:hypothetical protein